MIWQHQLGVLTVDSYDRLLWDMTNYWLDAEATYNRSHEEEVDNWLFCWELSGCTTTEVPEPATLSPPRSELARLLRAALHARTLRVEC